MAEFRPTPEGFRDIWEEYLKWGPRGAQIILPIDIQLDSVGLLKKVDFDTKQDAIKASIDNKAGVPQRNTATLEAVTGVCEIASPSPFSWVRAKTSGADIGDKFRVEISPDGTNWLELTGIVDADLDYEKSFGFLIKPNSIRVNRYEAATTTVDIELWLF